MQSGFTFSPSPLRAINLKPTNTMTTIEAIREALSTLNQRAILCDLPDSEFVTGGAITNACRAAGYDESGRVTVNSINAWNMTVAQLADYLTQPVEA